MITASLVLATLVLAFQFFITLVKIAFTPLPDGAKNQQSSLFSAIFHSVACVAYGMAAIGCIRAISLVNQHRMS